MYMVHIATFWRVKWTKVNVTFSVLDNLSIEEMFDPMMGGVGDTSSGQVEIRMYLSSFTCQATTKQF